MPFDFDAIYLVYLLVAVSAGFLVEGIYLLFFSGASYRRSVNRRLKLLRNEPNRENILVQLRKDVASPAPATIASGWRLLTGWFCNPA